MMANRLSQPPFTPPQCRSMSSLSGIDIDSATIVGLLTCPEILNNLVPVFRSRPKLANHSGPRRQIVGATATDPPFPAEVGLFGCPTTVN